MAKAGDRSLEETPSWAVAVVCAVFVVISIAIEYVIHSLEKFFKKKKNKAMTEAIEKIKAELMLLGFISLLLTVGTNQVSKICIPAKIAHSMLPCKIKKEYDDKQKDPDNRRKLLGLAEDMIWRRSLAAGDVVDHCATKNQVPLISSTALHEVHIFIFVLGVLHVSYSVILMLLGRARTNKWKSWEAETDSLEYQFTNDPARFRFANQTSFVKRHTGLSRKPGFIWIVAFFRQFFGSISKVDYLTIRRGFIHAHFSPNSKFDFHKYIQRSMEDDYKKVVGISLPLWILAFGLIILNVRDWYTLTWITFVPLIILLLVGMKLETVITDMAHQIEDRSVVLTGAPIVEPSNTLFWFNRPEWILYLIHFTLFENAFQMAYFLYIWYEFGIKSCFHENLTLILIRIVFGIIVQILCSSITFPLYCLVTQMGSHWKQAIFEEHTAKALMKWRKAAKDRRKLREAGVAASSNGEYTPSVGSSPVHLLHNHLPSTINTYQSDIEMSETEAPTPVSHENIQVRR